MRRACPTLILHGDADKTVPVAEAYHLQQVLEAKKIPYEVKIYPGAGHYFTGETWEDAGLECKFPGKVFGDWQSVKNWGHLSAPFASTICEALTLYLDGIHHLGHMRDSGSQVCSFLPLARSLGASL